MRLPETALSEIKPGLHLPEHVIVIGASTGGPQALHKILPQIPPRFPAGIIIVQNMRPGFTRVLAGHLSHVCKVPISEPQHGQTLTAERILMVPCGVSVSLSKTRTPGDPSCTVTVEDVSENLERYRTRITEAMTSAAKVFGRNAVGVLLTGIGEDGRDGMRAIAEAGGVTIAQDEASCVVHDLPLAAISAGVVHEVLPLWNIAERITELGMRNENADAA